MDVFFTVLEKVGVMVVLIAIGYVLTKKDKLTQRGSTELTWVLMNVVTPCVIIDSFIKLEDGALSPQGGLYGLFLSFLAIGAGLIFYPLFFKKTEESKRRVYRFSVIFSNTGFMGIPLVQAVLGSEGIVYASIFIAVFNFMFWTIGYKIMSGHSTIKLKNILLNPGTIGLSVGVLLYAINVNLPQIISSPIENMAFLNTPVAMIVFGHFISKINLREILAEKNLYLVAFLKLIFVPSIALLIVALFKPEYSLFMCVVIQSCTPSATGTVLFAALLKADAETASKTVAATTVFSLITIPIFITLAQILSENIL